MVLLSALLNDAIIYIHVLPQDKVLDYLRLDLI